MTSKYLRYRGNDKLGHVRGFIDDGVVIRWWRAHKQRWEYEFVYLWQIEMGTWRWGRKRHEKLRDRRARIGREWG